MVEGIKAIQKDIGAEYCELLNFERRETCFFIQTKKFLGGSKGRQTWTAINKLIKQLGGHWVSAGKESHWEIPLEKSEVTKPKTEAELVQHEAQALIQACREAISRLEKVAK